MAQICCEKLFMSYDNNLVLRDVSFNVEKGDYLCILGENGSGKTTLIKGILGLLPKKHGTIIFDEGVKPREIGYLPQQTTVQKNFPATVLEVVLSGCLNSRGLRPFYSKREKNKALEQLDGLGIFHLKNQPYKTLSGGQRQRVLLARALCATERVLVLDEPVAGLDPRAAWEFYAIVKKLNEEKKVTIIMVSHDIKEAVVNANKILQLGESVEFFGSSQEYLNSEEGRRFLSKVREDGKNQVDWNNRMAEKNQADWNSWMAGKNQADWNSWMAEKNQADISNQENSCNGEGRFL
jgi:zinc transport system ATP-binding protein